MLKRKCISNGIYIMACKYIQFNSCNILTYAKNIILFVSYFHIAKRLAVSTRTYV